ncbi:hypothetical protein [Planosporangium mesophilum]|uniref:Uncharacterized protein n=1 Tax=Planosporangium mesophilum TaxID=689768 RepID=A0A8J3T8D9_9ACTN|nr:hypothetical protein [Planosporangium mesophilum]NJC81927.1 hypothetical protein [Planosporangium mesophilum]GII20411.1 hypothetical protein Pme01_00080 [Planosporangium mesophilum]
MAQWLLAMVRDNQEEMTRLRDDPDPERGSAVMDAAFVLAVHQRFAAGHDVRDIGRFVAALREPYPVEKFRQIDAEAEIRAALGEGVNLDGIDVDTRTFIRIMTFWEVVRQESMSDRDVAALLVEAERLAYRPLSDG